METTKPAVWRSSVIISRSSIRNHLIVTAQMSNRIPWTSAVPIFSRSRPNRVISSTTTALHFSHFYLKSTLTPLDYLTTKNRSVASELKTRRVCYNTLFDLFWWSLISTLIGAVDAEKFATNCVCVWHTLQVVKRSTETHLKKSNEAAFPYFTFELFPSGFLPSFL